MYVKMIPVILEKAYLSLSPLFIHKILSVIALLYLSPYSKLRIYQKKHNFRLDEICQGQEHRSCSGYKSTLNENQFEVLIFKDLLL